MDEDELPQADFEQIVERIEEHGMAELVMFDRHPVNGNVTFKFYGTDAQMKGKLVFDEVSDDMVDRAHAVLDLLATTNNVEQREVERVWDSADGEPAVSAPLSL